MENETTDTSYKVKTQAFEGPFGVLLEMVEKRKLFINDVSLATVTEDFLNYINSLEGEKKREISSFIVVASTLILIKSKSLLPGLNLTDEEKLDISSLERRLALYKLFGEISAEVKKQFGKQIIFPAQEKRGEIKIFLPEARITPALMQELASEVLGRMPKKAILQEVEVKKVISIEEMLEKLTDRIQNSLKMSFKEFTGGAKTKEEKVFVIVGFLAMLELVRNGILNAVQENNFEDITIEKSEALGARL